MCPAFRRPPATEGRCKAIGIQVSFWCFNRGEGMHTLTFRASATSSTRNTIGRVCQRGPRATSGRAQTVLAWLGNS
jgi:hypothetical protein